jgi:hypothetical protein
MLKNSYKIITPVWFRNTGRERATILPWEKGAKEMNPE